MFQEKARKKKKIKAIKLKNKSVIQEVEATAAQSSWQKFMNKVLLLCADYAVDVNILWWIAL